MTPEKPAEGLAEAVRRATGKVPTRSRALHGGCIAEVIRIDLEGGGACVAKLARLGDTAGLAVEAWMLRYLAETTDLPVPAVLHEADGLLLMDYVETSGGLNDSAETHAAELLAALHGQPAAAFGYERDTVIGPLPQPNSWTESWRDFFRDHRLMHFGRLARERGRLPAATLSALERLAGKLDHYIGDDASPALIHGDMWAGNVLTRNGRIAAFIDPAIYFADPEIELAYSALFGTFGEAFFRRYAELRPLDPGFFEARRDIYNLYPLLVHSALFGGHYPQAVARIVERYG